MELDELSERLPAFAREMYGDPAAEISGVHKMPGHAGFSYGFTVHSRGREESWFLRIPPPNVQWRGTADVLRQAAVLRALDGTTVPHCSVRWAGDDLRWFGRPYFVVPKLEGDVLRLGPDTWGEKLDEGARRDVARQAMSALAEIHRLDWRPLEAKLGAPIPFEDDVLRWDRFLEKAAEPERLALVPEIRAKLLEGIPRDAPVGVFHGDFQWANLFFRKDNRLLAVIDWELVGIGATLNDVGWIATFNDPEAWVGRGGVTGFLLPPDELVELYAQAWRNPLPDLRWFRALAAYKFAIITGFNLGLHRRGRRHDPIWEVTGQSMVPLLERAAALCR